MANGEPPITSGARDRLLEQVLATLAEKYIFPDVAARIATEIRTGSRRALYHYPVARPVRPALAERRVARPRNLGHTKMMVLIELVRLVFKPGSRAVTTTLTFSV